MIAPLRGQAASSKPWEGVRPWEGHRVTSLIPVLEWNPLLEMAVESLLLQTVAPLVILIDTGSVETTAKLDSMRTRNQIEVISIRSSGWKHPSMPVASALNAAWSMVATPYCHLGHNDVILKRRNLMEEAIELAAIHKAVGYQISPRAYAEWPSELGHTFTVLDVKAMDMIGMSWSMREYCNQTGKPMNPHLGTGNDPDTERQMNRLLALNGINPHFIGFERNYERTNDDQIDHVRSRTSGLLYSPTHSAKAELWEADAIMQARLRHSSWSSCSW